MATIKAIEGRSVHQIQSGQVIVDLISVVKELVENSLDAGATSVEIRFKNHGLDSIEVQDNGKGIPPDDFETVALKHYTSKLSRYEDLTSLDTFGFRGEALSSLCALSKFHIITARAEDGAVGRKLDFETSGKLKGNAVTAAQKGTTVSVEDLFYNLPVRRKELEKNVKREYQKVISHLHAYACICVGVRFAVTNHMPKAKKTTVFSTKSNTTTKENITNVFGTKALLALVKLDLHLEMEPSNYPQTQSARNWPTQPSDRSREVHVQGYISKPVFGEGRQAPDRQMFFVNSRPCGLPQVSKVVNEVYKSFNVTQMPFVFANLVMDTNAYDVNVSPDKRSIMLHDQTALLESLKASLTELFEKTDHTVPQSQLPNRKLPGFKPLTVSKREAVEEEDDSGGVGLDGGSDDDDPEPDETSVPLNRQRRTENGATGSLIESWVGRDSGVRRETSSKASKATSLSGDEQRMPEIRELNAQMDESNETDQDGLDSEGTQAHTRAVEPGEHRNTTTGFEHSYNEQSASHMTTSHEPDPMGSPYDDLFSQRPIRMPNAVEQFNAIVHRGESAETAKSVDANDLSASISDDERAILPKSEIPVITPGLQKASPGPVQTAFDRMRPLRTPAQTAEVKIGDNTITTMIGSSPPYKKRRIHQPANSQSIAQFVGSPLLARGLRNFVAPGSQLELDSSMVSQAAHRPVPSSQPSGEDDEEDTRAENTAPHDTEAQTPPPRSESQNLDDSDHESSDPLDKLLPAPANDDEYDEDYIDEREKKIQEDEKVARLIHEAEMDAAQPTETNLRRASQVLKNGTGRKESTLQLMQYSNATLEDIRRQFQTSAAQPSRKEADGEIGSNAVVKDAIDDADAESKLSLTVSKTDFERMYIIGQFNLGFILAVRPRLADSDEDQLFIIDQHAADEKYNYERLQRTVTLQSQRLVRPKPLDLTAIEEEIILNNADALKANGFEIEIRSDIADDDDSGTGRYCRLITLPISGEKTFDLSDLEELLHLLSEAPSGSSEIPRPKKVQKMLAMRACRSSIMVGKTLAQKQMEKVVRHMGEMEKPWNCPHGRPTMRHLAGLGSWVGWEERDGIGLEDDQPFGATVSDKGTNWQSWLDQMKG